MTFSCTPCQIMKFKDYKRSIFCRGEGGGEWRGGPLWSPVRTHLSIPHRATIKALPTPLRHPRPYGNTPRIFESSSSALYTGPMERASHDGPHRRHPGDSVPRTPSPGWRLHLSPLSPMSPLSPLSPCSKNLPVKAPPLPLRCRKVDQYCLNVLGGGIERHFLRPVIGHRGDVPLPTDEGRRQVHIIEVVLHNPGMDVATKGRVVRLFSHDHDAVGFAYRRRDRLFVKGHQRAQVHNVEGSS